ncbi:unnamed protein product [Allacma fusca]|uniref:Ubiquitin carboxyl-terminal hydrolase 36 n=1 Tax=Allacma fusca TaxID=39272 RepID=A0A8J2LJ59_9HEXA|nr:unnamed protein product [Allacma fusca]
MPSVASLFGSDLVSGALRSTLNQVQKNCSFLNFKQLSKKERRKEKKLQRKLTRRYGFLRPNNQNSSPSYQALLSPNKDSPLKKSILREGPLEISPLKKNKFKKRLQKNGRGNSSPSNSLSDGSFSNSPDQEDAAPVDGESAQKTSDCDSENSDLGDFGCDDWTRDNPPLEFNQDGPQVSAFTLTLRDKYPSLNQEFSRSMEVVAPVHNQAVESSSSSPKTYGVVEEASGIPTNDSAVSAPKLARTQEEPLIDIFSPATVKREQSLVNGKVSNSENVSANKGQVETKLANRIETNDSSKAHNGTDTRTHNGKDSRHENGDKKPEKERKLVDCDLFSARSPKSQENPKSQGSDQKKVLENGVKTEGLKTLNGVVNNKKPMVQTNLSGFVVKQPSSLSLPALPLKKKVEENNFVKLPEPKVVLYERSKIKPGCRTRMPIGCGFINLGNTCYMNATLQALFHTPAFLNWLLDELNERDHRDRCERNNQSVHQCTICPMSSSVFGVYHRNGNPIRPVHIHNKLRTIGKNFSYGRQEDAHEFLRLLLESMERSYLTAVGGHRLDNRSKETTPLGQIFGGYTRGEVRCLTCRHVSTTFHPHAELQLDIREVNNVEDALAFYFQKEKLDNNDYKCEKCKTVQPATKQQFMELAPIVLCIQLKRFRACGSKIKKPIFINEKLNLSRFMFKRGNDRNPEAEYRLVGLVTHMGPSPNCGHYTAIAQASNGNYYQFDDSYVRMTSLNHAQNADAYVIIYETTNRKSASNGSPRPGSTSSANSESSPSPATTVKVSASSTSTASTNGNSSVSSASKVIPQTLPKPTVPEKPSAQSPSQPKKIIPTNAATGPKNPFIPRPLNNGNNFLNKSSVNNGMGVKTFSINGSPTLGPSAKIFSHSSNTKNNFNNNNRFVSKDSVQFKSSTNRFLTYANNKPSPTKPPVLVPYADDSDDDDSRSKNSSKSPSPGRSLTKSPLLGVSRNGSSEGKKPTGEEPATTKVYQPPAPYQIKTWNSTEESKLGKVLELDRKRPFLKSKDELEDEDIDSGRSKKKPKSEGTESTRSGLNPFDKASERFRRD